MSRSLTRAAALLLSGVASLTPALADALPRDEAHALARRVVAQFPDPTTPTPAVLVRTTFAHSVEPLQAISRADQGGPLAQALATRATQIETGDVRMTMVRFPSMRRPQAMEIATRLIADQTWGLAGAADEAPNLVVLRDRELWVGWGPGDLDALQALARAGWVGAPATRAMGLRANGVSEVFVAEHTNPVHAELRDEVRRLESVSQGVTWRSRTRQREHVTFALINGVEGEIQLTGERARGRFARHALNPAGTAASALQTERSVQRQERRAEGRGPVRGIVDRIKGWFGR